jgi:hypothetical protein
VAIPRDFIGVLDATASKRLGTAGWRGSTEEPAGVERLRMPLDSVEELLGKIRDDIGHTSTSSLTVYRGHRDFKWKLVPKIARSPFKIPEAFCKEPRDKSAERNLYLFFRDYSAALMPVWVSQGPSKEVSWRILVVGQHHGLTTRLLDWTLNPLVGLFFAIEGKPEPCTCNPPVECDGEFHDSELLILKNRRAFTVEGLAAEPSNEEAPLYRYDDNVGLLRPPMISPRIVAQGSMFTIQRNPGIEIHPDHVFRIPYKKRDEFQQRLNELGVNRRVLFPDLDGISDYLRWEVRNWPTEAGIQTP